MAILVPVYISAKTNDVGTRKSIGKMVYDDFVMQLEIQAEMKLERPEVEIELADGKS